MISNKVGLPSLQATIDRYINKIKKSFLVLSVTLGVAQNFTLNLNIPGASQKKFYRALHNTITSITYYFLVYLEQWVLEREDSCFFVIQSTNHTKH